MVLSKLIILNPSIGTQTLAIVALSGSPDNMDANDAAFKADATVLGSVILPVIINNRAGI